MVSPCLSEGLSASRSLSAPSRRPNFFPPPSPPHPPIPGPSGSTIPNPSLPELSPPIENSQHGRNRSTDHADDRTDTLPLLDRGGGLAVCCRSQRRLILNIPVVQPTLPRSDFVSNSPAAGAQSIALLAEGQLHAARHLRLMPIYNRRAVAPWCLLPSCPVPLPAP